MKNKKSKTKKTLFRSVKGLCTAALLAALAVVISYICKSFTVTMSVRITFENLPIILSGYILGPFAGLVTGLCADIVSTAATYGIGGINPVLTLGAGFVGFAAGIVSHHIIIKNGIFKIFATVYSSHITGNMIIKTVGLYLYYRTPPVEIIARILVYIGIAAAEGAILSVMLKSKGIKNAIGGLRS